jgi:formate--tetrahydrofolate ligase
MSVKSDIEIAQAAELLPIESVAQSLGIGPERLELYGRYKAKVRRAPRGPKGDAKAGKLILVTAINPTPAGEGKTTTTIGLGDALRRIGKKAAIALREPSLGPVFGMKGGAAGGGYSQVVPMEDINLHFTGDFHAIGAANNLLAAMIDNHVYQGNALDIDPRLVTWKRCMDMNDRQLRFIADGLGGKANGVPREDGFEITAASEVMAILCLSRSFEELKLKLGSIIVGYSRGGAPVAARELKAEGAMAALLRDALMPNLVQTLEHTPAFVHGGPFANIAHGCNSVMATAAALELADYAVTEAGFGADLGAEKFIDIKCRAAGFEPAAVAIVATVKALKMHGGARKDELGREDLAALERGLPNLLRHIENVTRKFGLPAVVALNRFSSDAEAELALVADRCAAAGARFALSEVWEKGGAGGVDLAREVVALAESPRAPFRPLYDERLPIREKIETIVREIYGGDGVDYHSAAQKEIDRLEELGFGALPICVAKTQYSLSDDQKRLGRPEGFRVTVRNAKVSAGAGFVVVLTGDIMTMPGLPKVPSAEMIDVDAEGRISGLS